MAKEIEAKIYEALGIDRDLVQPIDPDAMVPGEVPLGDLDAPPTPIEQAA